MGEGRSGGVSYGLAGRRIIVTGGSTGIGRALVRQLVDEGAKVFTVARHATELEAPEAEGEGQVFASVADVAKPQDVERLFREADEALGGLDAVVLNAGVGSDPIGEAADAEWRYAVEANLTGAMACAKRALERLRDRPEGGAIVFVGSIAAEKRAEGESVYAATKAGLEAFSETLHREEGEHGVRVSVIEPGATATPMQHKSKAEEKEAVEERKMLEANDIADAIRWTLAQPARSNVVRLKIEPIRQSH